MSERIGIIIQARVGSSRMPGKVLLPFFENQSILEILISKIKQGMNDLPLVVATSRSEGDDKIEFLCKDMNVDCFRGDENNVLGRFIDAAKDFNIDTIIRVCADNPFLDVGLIKYMIAQYKANTSVDYCSYCTQDNTPVIKTHFGFFAEIVSLKALVKTTSLTSDPLYLEHVTNYIYSSGEFSLNLIELPEYLKNRKDLRFTIDDNDDFDRLKELFATQKDGNLNIQELVNYVDDHQNIHEGMKQTIKKYTK
ncbi:MAG: hypothetical protein R2766_13310 [Saprospiraceae bacterium]